MEDCLIAQRDHLKASKTLPRLPQFRFIGLYFGGQGELRSKIMNWLGFLVRPTSRSRAGAVLLGSALSLCSLAFAAEPGQPHPGPSLELSRPIRSWEFVR